MEMEIVLVIKELSAVVLPVVQKVIYIFKVPWSKRQSYGRNWAGNSDTWERGVGYTDYWKKRKEKLLSRDSNLLLTLLKAARLGAPS